jgi:hypothetical protein
MWVFLSVVAICATALYIFKQGINFEPRLVIEAGTPPLPPELVDEDGEPIRIPALPKDIMEFIAMDSSSEAREDMRLEAQSLYAANQNWDTVLNALNQRYGERD